MAVTPADLLAASLPPRLTFSPTNQSAAPATDDAGTPAAADFQNVLSSLRTATPTDPSATPTTPLPDSPLSSIADGEVLPEDLLDAVLVDEDDATADAATDPNTALSLLLAVVTANPATTAEVVPVEVTSLAAATPTEQTAEVTPEAVPTPATPAPAEVRSRADEIRLAQSPNRPAAPTTRPAPQSAAPTAPAVDTTPVEATPTPIPTPAAPTGAVPAATTTTAATPADTLRAAARTPTILPQAPVVVDPTQALPGGVPTAATPPVFPPVAAPDPVRPTPAVTSGQPLNVALDLRANFAPPAAPVTTPEAAAASPFAAVLRQEATPPTTPTTPVAPAPVPIAAAPVPTSQPVVAAVPEPAVGPLPIPVPPAAAVEARPPAETILSTAVTATPVVTVPVREPLAESTPVDSTNTPDLTATTGTPVAGLVPQAIDARPTPAPAATAAPASPAVQLADSIVTHASLAERDGKVEFQIRLDPAELGPVKIKVVAHGDRLSAEVVVSNDAVRQMVESQLPDLRQRLAEAGLNLPTLDVSTGDGGQNGRSQDANEWERAFGGFRQVATASSSPRRPVMRATTGGAGSLDVMV